MNGKPNNLLFEIFALGMQAAISGAMNNKPKEIAKIAETEMDNLAKKFGYTGLNYFDKVF